MTIFWKKCLKACLSQLKKVSDEEIFFCTNSDTFMRHILKNPFQHFYFFNTFNLCLGSINLSFSINNRKKIVQDKFMHIHKTQKKFVNKKNYAKLWLF